MINLKEVALIIIIIFANIIEGITGFAGTMLAMPASMLLIGVNEAKLVLCFVALMVSIIISIQSYKDFSKKEFIKILFFMLIGMGIGIYLFSIFPASFLKIIYGVIIILISLNGLVFKLNLNFSKIGLGVILICAGIIHGMFLSGGALLVIYAIKVIKDKSVIRATLEPIWIVLNSLVLIQNILFNDINPYVIKLSVYSIIPVIIAVSIGEYLHKRINQKFFIRLTYVLLIISGITLLI